MTISFIKIVHNKTLSYAQKYNIKYIIKNIIKI